MIKIDGSSTINLEVVEQVARHHEKIQITEEAIAKIQKCRRMVEEKIQQKAVMYGITTGIGELADVILSPEQTAEFQKYLIYSHAAGCGEPVALEDARAAIFSRTNMLCKGFSGLRPIIVQTLAEMLNKGVTPVMCQKGSVGACGDLSPMGQMALVLMGEGEAFYQGERLPGNIAMKKAAIPTIVFQARDGLATINGSNLTAGMGSLQIIDAEKWLKQSEISAAMSLDVLKINTASLDERIHKARGYQGCVNCAANLRKMLEGSEILALKEKKVQDAYSLRSTPQVIGSAKHAFQFAREMFEIELNGIGDNPIFFPDDNAYLTGANFQGTPLAFGLEAVGIAVTTCAVLSERRTNRLINPHLNRGLPAFLTKGAGMFSGTMLSQYTAGALICEARILSNPAATGSIPAAADQEDFVSMSMTTAIKTRQILDNCETVVAIEMLNAAQALEFRKPLKPGKGVQAAYEVIRKYVQPLEADRPLYNDINCLSKVVKSGEILKAVEAAVGPLA